MQRETKQAGKGKIGPMPRYNMRRQGYNIIVKGLRLVNSGVCGKLNHEIRFDTGSHTHPELMARNKIVSEFMGIMNDRDYTPDGPTMYCMDCQEECQHKGMEG